MFAGLKQSLEEYKKWVSAEERASIDPATHRKFKQVGGLGGGAGAWGATPPTLPTLPVLLWPAGAEGVVIGCI